MPCIRTNTSTEINESQRKQLQHEFGQIISILPGKSEQWLMLQFNDNQKMCLAGDDSAPAAYVEVSILGKSDRSHFEKLTAKICDTLQSVLSIPSSRIYVKYEECTHWGWNGQNF